MRPVIRFNFWISPILLAVALLILWSAVPAGAYAQSDDSQGLVRVGGGEHLTIGGLLQTDAYMGRADGDGFRVRSTRLRFGGQAETLQYAVQLEFASSSPLLDAFVGLPLSERVNLRAGVFKAPFSGEILTGRPDLLLAERARVVNNVAPGRDVGVSLKGTLLSDRLTATIGTFNGTPGLRALGTDPLLYVGRVQGQIPVGRGELEVGSNAGYSIDEALPLPTVGQSPRFSGTRVLFGVDARLDIDRWLLEGELDAAWLSPDNNPNTINPFGFYVTAGAVVQEGHQVLIRFDRYDPDAPGQPFPNQLTGGYNYKPTSMLRVLLNYQAPTSNLGDGTVTARLQVAIR